MKFFSQKKCFGYTLIESLVAVTLFTLAVTSVSSIYVVYSRAQRQTGLRQATVQQLNFDIEKIAQDIRMKRIIFSDADSGYRKSDLYTLDTLNSASENPKIWLSEFELGLMDENGLNKEVYFFIPSAMDMSITCPGYIGKGVFYKFTNGRCEPLFTLQEVTIKNVSFYITPSGTPFPKKKDDCVSEIFLEHRQQCSCSNQWQCSSLVCKEGGCLENQPIVTITLTAQMKNGRTITVQTSVASRQYAP